MICGILDKCLSNINVILTHHASPVANPSINDLQNLEEIREESTVVLLVTVLPVEKRNPVLFAGNRCLGV